MHPGLDQAAPQAEGKRQAAVVIEQATHLHPTLGRLHQGLDHRLGAGARLHQIQLKLHLVLGTGNRHEHLREKIRAVDQQFIAVGAAPGEHRAAHVSAP